MLHLIRHGRSRPEPAVNPAHWRLHDDAATGLTALRESGVLPPNPFWCASSEPKAMATAAALADESDVQVIHDLREQDRPTHWYDDAEEFEATVARALTEPDRPAEPGWEPAARTTERVLAAVHRLVEIIPVGPSGEQRDLALAGHGTAWTLLIAAITGTPPDLEAWRRMRMPDHAALDLASRRLVQPWGAWGRAS